MMTAEQHRITRADVVPMAEFAKLRQERRRALLPVKKLRRIEVGPSSCFYFESYDTMWLQVHEMLFIEKGGEDQIAGELEAYNALIPQGRELVATVMFEIDNEVERHNLLARIGGIENAIFMSFGGETVAAVPDDDAERTREDGKASSVHFVHFRFNQAQIAKFRQAGAEAMLGFKHPNYGHLAVLPEASRVELAKDFA